jgi:hypothetical protein
VDRVERREAVGGTALENGVGAGHSRGLIGVGAGKTGVGAGKTGVGAGHSKTRR